MRVLIIGGTGMLGHKLVQAFQDEFEVFATIRGNFSDYEKYGIFEKEKTFEKTDVRDLFRIGNVVRTVRPDVVFNAAGIVKQLPTSKDIVQTLLVNSIFPHQLKELTEQNGVRLLTISTDCVFSGRKGGYTEADPPDALDLYGRSKNLGEVLEGDCLTLRTSIIGRELSSGHSLIEWFLANTGKQVKGFTEAVFTGFPTVILAEIIRDIIVKYRDLKGLYHLSSNPINKFDLLQLVKKHFKLDIEIARDFDFKIDRSLNSDRFREAARFTPLDWDLMIEKMAGDATPYKDWR